MAITAAIIGKNIDKNVIAIALNISTKLKNTFPMPAVAVVEANLVTLVLPEIIEAVPPPAMAAILHLSKGSISAKVATITKVPAIAARHGNTV